MNIAIHHILSRRSIRKYTDQPVLKEDLRLILRCGEYAPTARGRQPWHFSIITQRNILNAISQENARLLMEDPNTPETVRASIQAGEFDTFRGAPCAVIVAGEDDSWLTVADCANAVTNMANAAQAMELGSCYIASHRPAFQGPKGEELARMCKVPEGYTVLFALALGHPAEAPEAAPRRENTISYL